MSFTLSESITSFFHKYYRIERPAKMGVNLYGTSSREFFEEFKLSDEYKNTPDRALFTERNVFRFMIRSQKFSKVIWKRGHIMIGVIPKSIPSRLVFDVPYEIPAHSSHDPLPLHSLKKEPKFYKENDETKLIKDTIAKAAPLRPVIACIITEFVIIGIFNDVLKDIPERAQQIVAASRSNINMMFCGFQRVAILGELTKADLLDKYFQCRDV